jgi:hypothetical protein
MANNRKVPNYNLLGWQNKQTFKEKKKSEMPVAQAYNLS